MAEEMENKMVKGGTKASIESAGTTYTKIFVGGLAWETRKDYLQSYFEQFGEILEAVVISDRRTGRSKGYGFVTFKDPDSATRACQNPNPVIDGRRANCNIAAFGVQKKHQTVDSPQAAGIDKIGPASRFMEPLNIHGHSYAYFYPHIPQYAFPYSVFGYPVYPDDVYAMNFYNVYGGKQFPSYYPTVGTDSHPGMYLNYCNPSYAQNGESGPSHHIKMTHNSHQNHGFGTSPLPASATSSLPTTEDRGARCAAATEATETRMPETVAEQKS